MPNWIQEIVYTKTTVTTSTWTRVATRTAQRRYLAFRNNATADFFVAATNTDPDTDTTGDAADLIKAGEKFYFDATLMPTSEIWVFQSSGTDKDFHTADVKS